MLGLLQFNTHKINRTTKVFDLHVEILRDLRSQITVQIAHSNQEAMLSYQYYIGSLKKTHDTWNNTAAVSVRTYSVAYINILQSPMKLKKKTRLHMDMSRNKIWYYMHRFLNSFNKHNILIYIASNN